MTSGSERRLSAPQRRATVVAIYASYVAAALLWVIAATSNAVVLLLFVLLLSASGIAIVLLFKGTRYWRWGNAPDHLLDEFEVSTRNAAFRHAYWIIAVLPAAYLFATQHAQDSIGWMIGDRVRDVLFWGWYLLVLTLPAATLAWQEDARADD